MSVSNNNPWNIWNYIGFINNEISQQEIVSVEEQTDQVFRALQSDLLQQVKSIQSKPLEYLRIDNASIIKLQELLKRVESTLNNNELTRHDIMNFTSPINNLHTAL